MVAYGYLRREKIKMLLSTRLKFLDEQNAIEKQSGVEYIIRNFLGQRRASQTLSSCFRRRYCDAKV